jgi:hypothetical protein
MAVKVNQFPQKHELERVNTLQKFHKLYDTSEQLKVLKLHELIKKQYKKVKDLVYLAHGIPARITEFYGDFVLGDVERLVIQAPTESETDQQWVEDVVFENDLKESMSDFAEDQSEFGFVPLLGYTDDDGKYHITEVAADQYFPQTDGSVIFITYKRDPAHPTGEYLLAHTQHYQMESGKAIIEHQAWRANKRGVVIEEYSLEEMGKLVGRTLEAKVTLDIDELPIRQIDNGRRMKSGFGKSDYYDICPQLAEINERSTQAATQFLKNMDAKMIIPASSLEEDEEEGKTTVKHTEAFVLENKEDPRPEYVTNENPLIDNALEFVMSEMRFIEWMTGVPMWALTKGAAPERVESLRIQLYAALRKTSKKRAKLRRGVLDMMRIGAKMTGQSEDLQSKDCIMVFSDPLPVDEQVQISVESEKIRSGISSRLSSMKRVENIDDEEAEAEMQRIAAEDQIAGIGNPENAPQL